MTELNTKRPGNKLGAGNSDLVSLNTAGKLQIYRSLFFFLFSYQKCLTKLDYGLQVLHLSLTQIKFPKSALSALHVG